MRIVVDGMGGDNAPKAVVGGVVEAIKEYNVEIVVTGDKDLLEKEFSNYEFDRSKLEIVHTTEIIENEDKPVQAIRRKKDSSMVVGLNIVKEKKADAIVSAGSTGALLTGATLVVGRIKGIDRPALAAMLPAFEGRFLLMDAGANTNCKTINILQFAQMAGIYLKNTYNIEKPKIGLLNNGTEETKGNDLMKESYKLLKENAEDYGFEFIGNIEGREAFSGEVDAIVTDGFTGNIFLKTTEGVGKMVKRNLKKEANKSIFSKISLLPALPIIKRFGKSMDYKEYGGALFLGVKKPVIKAHGSSDAKLFEYTLKQAEQFVNDKTVDNIIEKYSELNNESQKAETISAE